MLRLIAFDADDTLWENDVYFRHAQSQFCALMEDFAPPDEVEATLLTIERATLPLYGYGVKGFTLSMMEAAWHLAGPALPSHAVSVILGLGQSILREPLVLFPEAKAVLSAISGRYRCVLVTKGDVTHQERKIRDSGLAPFFEGLEIVAEKDPATYTRLFASYSVAPDQALMLGNSLRSDVVSPIAAGAWGVFVPKGPLWALEAAPEPRDHPRYRRISALSDLPDLLDQLARQSKPR